jgi:hypothetical protein
VEVVVFVPTLPNKAMNRFPILFALLLVSFSVAAQSKTTPPTIVSLIEGVTGKEFKPDTVYATLSKEDIDILGKEPIANWSLPQASGDQMMYHNLVVGQKSYRLVIIKQPQISLPTAMLLRYPTAQSKPETIARGTLSPKEPAKAK